MKEKTSTEKNKQSSRDSEISSAIIDAANRTVEKAKCMLRKKDYASAKSKVEEAIELFPTIRYGKQMITVCEILHFSKLFNLKYVHYSKEIWSQILQIPSSFTELEIKTRYKIILRDLQTLKGKFPSVSLAKKFLLDVISLYEKSSSSSSNSGCKRKLAFSDDDNLWDDDDNATDDEDASYNDVISAGSPEFKRLRKEIFAIMPQNPHYDQLSSEYCPSVRKEMILGFEVIYLKLIQKIRNSSETPDNFLSTEKETEAEIRTLQKMGYDMKKVEDRFNSLVRLAKENQAMEKELEAINRDEMVEQEVIQSRISELEKEDEVSKSRLIKLKSEIAALKSKVGEQANLGSLLFIFKSYGMDIWK